MRARTRLAWGLASLTLAAAAVAFGPTATEHGNDRATLGRRLLGPFAPVAADLVWLRVQRARLDGREALALTRAESALRLDPANTEGWRAAATFLGLSLASPNREPSPERRRARLRSALALLERGERVADEPEVLAMWSGLLLATHAETDPELGWPGGAGALWSAAAEAFERAVALGSEESRPLLAAARSRGD